MSGRRLSIAALFMVAIASSLAEAHHPQAPTYWPRVELFDWVERLEPPSYRQRFNRPRYIGGKIAHHIAPSSQEAMSWHENKHAGTYRNHSGPMVKNYYYPKPWEMLPTGPRPASPAITEQLDPPSSY